MFTETFDPTDDLSRYTTEQLRVLAAYLESALLRLFEDGAVDGMTASEKSEILGAIAFLNRATAELQRRASLPSRPTAVHYETAPDGSAPVRLSFTVLVF